MLTACAYIYNQWCSGNFLFSGAPPSATLPFPPPFPFPSVSPPYPVSPTPSPKVGFWGYSPGKKIEILDCCRWDLTHSESMLKWFGNVLLGLNVNVNLMLGWWTFSGAPLPSEVVNLRGVSASSLHSWRWSLRVASQFFPRRRSYAADAWS